MDMEPLPLQQNGPDVNYGSNAFDEQELEALLNQLLPAEFHGDPVICHSSNPNQSSVSHSLHIQPLSESLSPASFHGDRSVAAGLPNPSLHGARKGHLDRIRLRNALPAGFHGELRGADLHEAMPESFHGDYGGRGAGRDCHVLHGRDQASKFARFNGHHEGSAAPVNPNFKCETKGRHSQTLQSPASFNEDAASSGHHRPARASKIDKARSVKDASRTESLRRKRISQFFSKLEVLLPPEDVIKYDRCSLIDSTIHYITSLEERVAMALKEREMCLDAMMQIDQRVVVEAVDRSKKEEPCKKQELSEAPINCSVIPKQLEEYVEEEELGARRMISISVVGDENIFINVVTHHLDPLQFSSLFTVLHHHHLQIITASLTRMDKMLTFSFFTKISVSREYNKNNLKDAISRALKQAA